MIRTARLLLRPWRDDDLAPFAAMSADAEVMRYLGGTMTATETADYRRDRIERHVQTHGFGKWAVELPGVAPFIGTVGLSHLRFAAPFAPAVEIAWRLARPFWGLGYATEAASAAMGDGFDRLGFAEIVALTTLPNKASARVAERLGMARSGEFDHPLAPAESPLRHHVLFRKRR